MGVCVLVINETCLVPLRTLYTVQCPYTNISRPTASPIPCYDANLLPEFAVFVIQPQIDVNIALTIVTCVLILFQCVALDSVTRNQN